MIIYNKFSIISYNLKEDNRMQERVMASFIMANVDLLDTYDLKSAYIAAMKKRALSDHGIYIEDNFLSINLSYEDNLKNFLFKKVYPKYKDIETYKFYQSFKFIGNYVSSLEGTTMKGSRLYIGHIVYLLLYIVNNEIDEDMERANIIGKNSGLNYDERNYSFTNFNTFGDVQVRKLNSGKIIFKGLTPEMKERLYKFYDITHR